MNRDCRIIELNGEELIVYEDGSDIGVWDDDKEGWRFCKDYLTEYGYIRVRIGRRLFRKHRIVYYAFNQDWNIFDTSRDNSIDHIDGDKTNNCISNLRVATHSENLMNVGAQRNSRTGIKCIYVMYRSHRDDWAFQIRIMKDKKIAFKHTRKMGDGKPPEILPEVPQVMIDIRDEKLLEHHGDFARLD